MLADGSQRDLQGERIQYDRGDQHQVGDPVGVNGGRMQRSVERFVEPEDAATEEDAQRCEQGPEEALPPVPERMGLIRGPDAAHHADEQEHLDRHVGDVGRGLGAQGHRPGHPCRHR